MFFGRYLLLGAGLIGLAGCDAGPITCASDQVQGGVLGYAKLHLAVHAEADLSQSSGWTLKDIKMVASDVEARTISCSAIMHGAVGETSFEYPITYQVSIADNGFSVSVQGI